VHSRFGGFLQALTREGLSLIPDAYVNVLKHPVSDKSQETEAVLERIRKHRLTAVVCGTDFLAFRLIDGLHAHGMRVPEDVSITGFDGSPVPTEQAELTTIRAPLHEMGVAALIRLENRVKAPSRPIRHVLHQGIFVPGATISAIERVESKQKTKRK
jgi:LacI family transcriptional regulator